MQVETFTQLVPFPSEVPMFGIQFVRALSINLRVAILFIMFMSSSAFAQQGVTCEGGVVLPIGAFFLNYTPPGCDGMPGFVRIGNGAAKVCMVPLVGGLDASQISITTSDGVMGSAIETNPAARDPIYRGVLDCLPSGSYMTGFAGYTQNVSMGAEGYTFAGGSSAHAPIDYKINGAPFRVLNPIDPMTGLVPSTLVKTWKTVSYDVYGNGVRNVPGTQTPYFLFDETNRSR